jgi:hypothetical protein
MTLPAKDCHLVNGTSQVTQTGNTTGQIDGPQAPGRN